MSAEQVPTQGFAVPPAAPGALQHSRNTPSAPPAPPAAPAAPAAPAKDVTQAPPPVPAVPQFPTNQIPGQQQPQAPAQPQEQAPALDPTIAAYIAAAVKEAQLNPNQNRANEVVDLPSNLNNIDVEGIENPQVRNLGKLLLNVVPDLDIERVFGKALAHGDASLLDVAYLKDKAGTNAQQLTGIAQQIVELVAADSAASEAAVYNAAGGEAAWRAAAAAFNKSAPKHIKTVAAQLLDSTNKGHILEGAKIVVEFARQGGYVAENAELLDATGGRVSEQGISKQEFQERLRAIKPEYQNPNWHNEQRELYRLRQLGKQRGL